MCYISAFKIKVSVETAEYGGNALGNVDSDVYLTLMGRDNQRIGGGPTILKYIKM